MFGGIKANEIWRKRYNKELTAVRDLDKLSFVRVSRLNWIVYVNRMACKGEVSQEFNSNPQGSRLRGRSKNRWWNCVQTGVNKCRIEKWKDRSRRNRADWEKSIKEVRVSIGM